MQTTDSPELHSSLQWLNSAAQTVTAQRGRVLALVFWNASSAYSHNLLAQVSKLKLRHPVGLAVIGIHLPKFDAEVDGRVVLKALNRLGVTFPVANDRGWVTWQHYGIRAWPSVALIDANGQLMEVFTGDDQSERLADSVARLINAGGGVPTIAGDGLSATMGQEMRTPLRFPQGIVATETHLYIADSGHHRILECTHEGRILREFGTGHADYMDGPAAEASFRYPSGLCMVREELYVSDTGNHSIRKIKLLDGSVRTVLGTGRVGFPHEGTVVSANEVSLNQPWGLASSTDRLFIAMAGCNQIWEYELGLGRLRIVAGTGELGIVDGPGRSAVFAHPSALVLVQPTLYVLEAGSSALRAINLQHNHVQTLVGQGVYEFGDQDGQRHEARLQCPMAMVLDPVMAGLWIADTYNGTLRKLKLGGGDMTTHSLPQSLHEPCGLAATHGSLWITDGWTHDVFRYHINSGLLQRVPVGE